LVIDCESPDFVAISIRAAFFIANSSLVLGRGVRPSHRAILFCPSHSVRKGYGLTVGSQTIILKFSLLDLTLFLMLSLQIVVHRSFAIGRKLYRGIPALCEIAILRLDHD